MDAATVQAQVAEIAQGFAQDRRDRQLRRHLEKADFKALAGAGYLLSGVPTSMGGLWQDIATSTRPIAEMLRTLAQGDPSVALVCAMHPAVLCFWLTLNDPPEEHRAALRQQQDFVFGTAINGAQWGTIISEPGSGGDMARTKAPAIKQADGSYRISGQKHFGSGSGVSDYMITTALPQGEDMADIFFLDLRDAKWDGSTGMKLVAEWDGLGMIATQSHAFEFTDFPALRLAWPGNFRVLSMRGAAFNGSLFTGVIVGVVQAAVTAARQQLARRKDDLHPYEQVEWTQIENQGWLIDQAYEGMLRAVEAKGGDALVDVLRGKTTIAELAESLTAKLCRVIGGGSFARTSHFGAAFEDVRALGFLRPPWVLAYDQLWARGWET